MVFTYSIVVDSVGNPLVQRSDGAFLSNDPTSPDWRAFLAWNSAQGTPLDYTTVRSVVGTRQRSIYNIITGADGNAGLNGLTSAQKTNVWNDFSTNHRWTTDQGPNQAVLLLAVGLFQDGIIAAGSTNSKLWAVACYVQDNPTYLVNPSFDATINVSGRW